MRNPVKSCGIFIGILHESLQHSLISQPLSTKCKWKFLQRCHLERLCDLCASVTDASPREQTTIGNSVLILARSRLSLEPAADLLILHLMCGL
jgi:hypothetical protein